MRRKILIYLAIITIGMVVLSAGLVDLQFQPGQPIPGAEPSTESVTAASRTENKTPQIDKVLQFPLALAFALILLILIISLVKKAHLKRILNLSLALVAVVLLAILLSRIKFPASDISYAEPSTLEPAPAVSYNIAPIGDPPQVLFNIVMVFILLGAAVLVIWLVWQTLHRRQDDSPLVAQAQAALQAIDKGDNLANIIVRCYLQMEKVAWEAQGIERPDSATPREFKTLLASQGIPLHPVRQLTGLFEKVRYGNKPLDRRDEQTAIESLSAIRAACLRKEAKST